MTDKLERALTSFIGGVNTAKAAHLLDDDELRRAEWAELSEDGALRKARGFARYSDDLGDGDTQGLYSYVKPSGEEVVLYAFNRKLYRLGASRQLTELPIQLQNPTGLSGTLDTGTPFFAGFAINTTYQYVVVAVRNGFVQSNKTLVPQGATVHPIILDMPGVYGANGYYVFRRIQNPDLSFGLWAQVDTAFNVEYDMGSGRLETRVRYVDQGEILDYIWPDDQVPGESNNTQMLLPAGTVDFQAQGDRCYFTAGDGVLWTDGVYAGVVAPAPYDATYGPNSLLNFNEPIHRCRALAWHQHYAFALNNALEPTKMYYSRLGRWDYWPGLSVIDAPEAEGGRMLSAMVLYNALCVSMTTGRWTLHGKTFTPDSANFDGYWSKVSSVGVTSGKSVARVPAFGRDLLVATCYDRNIHVLYADTAVEAFMNSRPVANPIRASADAAMPSLVDVTDWDNAVAVYHPIGRRYIVSFPADGLIWVGYTDYRADGQFSWFGPRTGMKISAWTVLRNGKILAADRDHGMVYEFEPNAYTIPKRAVDGSWSDDAYEMVTRTKEFTQLLKIKKLRRVYIRGKQEDLALTTCTVRVYSDYLVATKTVNFNESAVVGTALIGNAILGYVEAPLELTGVRTKGRGIAYELSNNSPTEPLTIYGIYELFSLKRPR